MPIVIKRYRNRKLYNTQSKRYITLEEIEQLIHQNEDIRVIENDTGNDITATTLSQIIFELEKNQTGVLPVNLLFSLAQSGGKRFDELRRNVFTSLNFTHHFDTELERRINLLVTSGELTQDEGNELFDKFLSLESKQEGIFENVESKISRFLKDQQIPTKEDYQQLMDKLDELSRMVERLNSSKEDDKNKEGKDQIIE